MDILGAVSGVAKVASGLFGLFGKKNKTKQLSPYEAMESQVKGAREHGEKYGFNPLTLLQYGATGGTVGTSTGGAPPLASVDLLTEGLKDVNDITSGDLARRRAADQAELDLAKIRLEQAKSGIGVPAIAYGVGDGLSPLGRRSVTQTTYGGTAHSRRFSMGENPVAPGRKEDIAPLTNSAGVFEMENNWTGGPVTIPGDGEPTGADELLTAFVFGAPQALQNHKRNAGVDTVPQLIAHHAKEAIRDKVNDAPGNSVVGYIRDNLRYPKFADDPAPHPQSGWAERQFGRFHIGF